MSDGFDDPQLDETAQLVRRVLQAEQMRPEFRDRLREELVAAGAQTLAGGRGPDPAITAEPTTGTAEVPAMPAPTARPLGGRTAPARPRANRGRPWRSRVPLGWAGAVSVAVAAAAIVVAFAAPGGPGPAPVAVSVIGDLAGTVSADPSAALRLRFSRPLDPAATRAAVHLQPAAGIRSTWDGDTLVVAALHGFAPNVGYLLTIDHQVARTADGAALASDLHVAFGTASVSGPQPAAGPPASLFRRFVAAADEGAEAPVTRTGAMLVTAARASDATGHTSGLLLIGDGTTRLSDSTGAICVSRSGTSVAYLASGGIVFADSDGRARATVPVSVDDGSPLGWIGDTEVSFVSGGRLRAVDRSATVRTLVSDPIDLRQDGVDIAPGGRWVYLRRGGAGLTGQLIDSQTGARHALAGIDGDPTFSADGASVFWLDGRGRLAGAASGGGPVRTVALPVSTGDVVSGLAISPVGSRFVYSVTHPDGTAELRLAALPGGGTLAVDTGGAGDSPNWAPSGQFFTVLANPPSGSRIQSVAVPAQLDDPVAAFEATAGAFAGAQLSGDLDAERALAVPGTVLPAILPATRATVLWVRPDAGGAALARIRLTTDATAGDPVVRQVEETVTLGPPSAGAPAGGPPVVRAVQAEASRPAPDGPQLTRLDTGARPGLVRLTFDSDLDPTSIGGATLTRPDGTPVPAAVSYDPASRTVTLSPGSPPGGPLVVVVGTDLRDVDGRGATAQLRLPVQLG